MAEAEPTIVAFCCTHCAYNAADLAGSLRVQYPPAVKVVEVPCTGRVEIYHLLRAFEEGVDGVLVAGCLPGNCHYLEGNLNARRRVEQARKMLKDIGLEPERLKMVHMSSAMGLKFAEEAQRMTDEIRLLGLSLLGRLRAPSSGGNP
jgi:coenzyme F420-reducing hydrogenase delta subunit